MSTELATTSSRGIVPRNVDETLMLATKVANSGLAPKDFKTPEAIMVAMLHGMELGLNPMQALQSICVINGRPSIWGDAALAVCMTHPDFEDIQETFVRGQGEENLKAVCIIKRKGRTDVEREFSVAHAKKAGLWGKSGPWVQYPQRMLQCRARSWALKDSFPDSLKGVAVADDIADVKPVKGREVRQATVSMPIDDAPETPAIGDRAESEIPEQDPATGMADHDLFE